MTELKCPICNKPMKEQIDGTCISYQETDCICNIAAPKIIWEEMAALRKKHNIYTKTCRMEKEFAEEELERTKKKLDIAVDALEKATEYLGNQEPLVDVMATSLHMDLSKALEQIKENKGRKENENTRTC